MFLPRARFSKSAIVRSHEPELAGLPKRKNDEASYGAGKAVGMVACLFYAGLQKPKLLNQISMS
jgi:hypothetical protein